PFDRALMQGAVAKLAPTDTGDVEDRIHAIEPLETGGQRLFDATFVAQVARIIAGLGQTGSQLPAMGLVSADHKRRVALLRRTGGGGFGDARRAGDKEYSSHKRTTTGRDAVLSIPPWPTCRIAWIHSPHPECSSPHNRLRRSRAAWHGRARI